MQQPSDTPPPPPPSLPQEPERPRAPQDERRRRPFWRELPILVVVAFAVALLIKSFLVQAFYIPSASMESTLLVGDRVLVEKVTYRFDNPDHGEVVVFEKDFGAPVEEDESFVRDIVDSFRSLFGFPTGGQQDFIKRVIAVGGDRVEGRDGKVFLNGQELPEPYLPEGTQTSSFGPTEIPEGMVFVMGDNRGNSDDSRGFGPIEVDQIIGHAFVLIWPPAHFGGL